MQRVRMWTSIMFMGLGVSLVLADGGYGTNKAMASGAEGRQKSSIVTQLYQNECASCHMAYQPEFLPKRSWRKIMKGLENHFGADATMDPKDQATLSKYLQENASDAKRTSHAATKLTRSIPKHSVLMRITEIPKFKREHREIPKRLIKQEKVRLLSNCVACHQRAEKGLYGERDIFIPNYGRWED